ncbi:MAG: 1-acyl-sn-glycerol-3-phosphate acyltransferase, partial [Saprospiraceae bacterium]|nr:1-acyl-sn-glycerol-3-phosphate acyltransferase [Saprospiraceae bacterium]
AIVISNHPSTLMDVLNVGIHIRQEMFFLANYGLFKNPVSNWLLTRLYCIPVKRREDVEEGENRNNDAAFELSYQHLEANGILYIAAEGVSWMNRWVRPFKTGTARIAFGTENRNNWSRGVKIIPVGLSYSAPNLFRSEVVVHFGKPVDAGEWAAAWQQNPEQAVDDCTALLEQRVRSLSIDTRDEAGEQSLGHWEEMLQNTYPVAGEEAFYRSRQLVETKLDDNALRSKTADYFSRLQALGLRDAGLHLHNAGIRWTEYLLLLSGFPFFLLGYLFWFLPCYLPLLLARKMKLYIGYDSNVKTLAGTVTFWIALAWAPHWAGMHNQWSAGLVILACIGLGYFAEWYMERAGKWLACRRADGLDVETLYGLQEQRQEILKSIPPPVVQP